MPTPCLSFAVRRLECAAGVMVTASHNPAKYNGYKVYGEDGCQITTKAAADILAEIEKLDLFHDVIEQEFETGLANGSIQYISDDVISDFIHAVKAESVLGENDSVDRNVAIIYSPLNGTGLKPVLRALEESGFTNVTVVKEQEQPDGNFPTCPYPNPEIREAMSLGMDYAKRENADLLLATDPDCDRVGIAVRKKNGDMSFCPAMKPVSCSWIISVPGERLIIRCPSILWRSRRSLRRIWPSRSRITTECRLSMC